MQLSPQRLVQGRILQDGWVLKPGLQGCSVIGRLSMFVHFVLTFTNAAESAIRRAHEHAQSPHATAAFEAKGSGTQQRVVELCQSPSVCIASDHPSREGCQREERRLTGARADLPLLHQVLQDVQVVAGCVGARILGDLAEVLEQVARRLAYQDSRPGSGSGLGWRVERLGCGLRDTARQDSEFLIVEQVARRLVDQDTWSMLAARG